MPTEQGPRWRFKSDTLRTELYHGDKCICDWDNRGRSEEPREEYRVIMLAALNNHKRLLDVLKALLIVSDGKVSDMFLSVVFEAKAAVTAAETKA